VALIVLTIGSSVFGWQLAKAVLINIGGDAPGAAIMLPSGATAATTLGWVASGLQAVLAVSSIGFSAKSILTNALHFAAGSAVSRILSLIPTGPIGPGGTPPFSFQAIEQALNVAQGNLVWNALEVARIALNRDSCRKYVGEGAYAALRKLWDNRRITYFPGVQFAAADGGPSWAETVSGPFIRTRIVLSYHWMTDNDVANRPDGANAYGISLIQRRAATLLHEVRHVLGRGYIEAHKNWTSDIVNNCFK